MPAIKHKNLIIVLVLIAVAALSWWWSASNGVELDTARDADRAVSVLVQRVVPRNFADELEALGTTRAAESLNISSRINNVITVIHFGEGQKVQRGDVLVELENSEAQANFAAAQSALVESRSQYQRSRELLRTQSVSVSQVEQLEARVLADEAALAAAQARLQDHFVRAPFAGVVGLRRVSLGALLAPSTIITTLDDTSTVLLDFEIPETFLSAVAVGQTLTARSAAYPSIEFPGVVATIDTRIDPATRAVTVRASLGNPEDLLKPGMFMTVRVLRDTSMLLLVPEQALVPIQSSQYLFLVRDGVVHQTEVTIGRRIPGEVEILTGLAEGEVIIVEGSQRVRPGSRVSVRPWTRQP